MRRTARAVGTRRGPAPGSYLCPFSQASPSVTSVSPVSILKVEVFPAPFTPRRPKHCGYRPGSPAAPSLPMGPFVHPSVQCSPRREARPRRAGPRPEPSCAGKPAGQSCGGSGSPPAPTRGIGAMGELQPRSEGPAAGHTPWSGPSAAGGGRAGRCCPPSLAPWPRPGPRPPARAAPEPVAWR